MLVDMIRTKLAKLRDSWRDKRLDGQVTVWEFFDFVREGIVESMFIVEPIASGREKKQLVLDFAGWLFDTFEPAIRVRYPWLNWLFVLIGGNNGIKDEFLALVSVFVEAVYRSDFREPEVR